VLMKITEPSAVDRISVTARIRNIEEEKDNLGSLSGREGGHAPALRLITSLHGIIRSRSYFFDLNKGS
jgi:hypothetical protein